MISYNTLHPMKFIGSAAVALVVLLIADEALNDERFTRATIVAIRQALASTGIHFWVYDQYLDGVLIGCGIVTAIPSLTST